MSRGVLALILSLSLIAIDFDIYRFISDSGSKRAASESTFFRASSSSESSSISLLLFLRKSSAAEIT